MGEKFIPKEVLLAAGLAVGVAGCDNLPKISVDYSHPPTFAEVTKFGGEIDRCLSAVKQGETVYENRLVDFVIMEDYMKIMGDPEARKKYRDSILETAEALNLKGNHEMAWRLLENLETSNNVFINTKK